MIAGLAWAPFAAARGVLAPLLAPSASGLQRRIGIAACAAHREDPGEALTYALFDEDPALKARALRAVGELGRVDLADTLRAELAFAGGDERRFWAAWAAALLGVEAAVPVLWSIADGGGPFAERACALVMRRLDVREGRVRLESSAPSPSTRAGDRRRRGPRRSRARALAAHDDGEPRSGARRRRGLCDHHRRDDRGPLAAPAPAGFRAGPSDDPADSRVAMDPDGPLRWPAAAALQAWWSARESDFRRGARYLGGAPMTAPALETDLVHAHQRRRAGAAIELTLRQPGRPHRGARPRQVVAVNEATLESSGPSETTT